MKLTNINMRTIDKHGIKMLVYDFLQFYIYKCGQCTIHNSIWMKDHFIEGCFVSLISGKPERSTTTFNLNGSCIFPSKVNLWWMLGRYSLLFLSFHHVYLLPSKGWRRKNSPKRGLHGLFGDRCLYHCAYKFDALGNIIKSTMGKIKCTQLLTHAICTHWEYQNISKW